VGEASSVQGDAAVFLKAYQNLGGTVLAVQELSAVAEAVGALSDCAVVVDALLGTGTSGVVREPMRSAILAWPAARTIAVDLPSGLDTDTGEIRGCCVRAEVTVTFQFAKKGFENPASRPYVGRLVVADIGIPLQCGVTESPV
jgi:NAD(P)H-hydrate epimerase